MRIIITGNKGFIGSNLTNYLISKNYSVIGYDIDEPVPDLTGVTHVIHLGAISSTTETNVSKIYQYNIEATQKLIDVCATRNIHLLIASSASVYGSTNRFSEYDPVNPKSLYALSKRWNECYSAAIKNSVIQNFRFFNVYGPGEDHKGAQKSVFHTFKEQAIRLKQVRQFANSDTVYRDFIHVYDVCCILEKFLTIKQSGIWNIGTGKATSFADIAAYIANKYDVRVKDVTMPSNIANQYQYYTKSNNTKLLSTIGSYEFVQWKDWLDDTI